MTPTGSDRDWSDHHGTVIREAAPDVPEWTEAEREALWQRVDAADPTPAVRRRRWRPAVAGAVVVLLGVGVAGAAAGNVFSAHTGRGPADAEDVELGGPGERLDPRAPDFAAVIDDLTTDIRFPTAKSRAGALSWDVDNYAGDRSGGSTVSTGAVRLWVAGHALCAWSDTWAVALRTGDRAGEERAADVVLDARTWPSITDTDPDLANDSEFAWLPHLEQAVRTDDPAAARAALRGNQSCMPGLAPELGLGKRW
ncbi:hypothetical protein ASC77_00140 [Nocardioides sp. Root1257]|uniref:hypothetical protein n=1 Tax=unclassified Nocardioides TaxID=2615069 RepID=UPI0006F37C05|nr:MULTISPECIES: hypothetical protein [unclassified Nocardioides]KQW52770.1 hypothetical protein ASC77_00140 [Nocardioides sp. Root1257]KRC55458.1 hypothetical protein ASE24_00140 [Nocardioides sp. Root224]